MAVASQATNPCSIPGGCIVASNCSLMLTVTESKAPKEQLMTFCKSPLKEFLYKSGLKIKKVKNHSKNGFNVKYIFQHNRR